MPSIECLYTQNDKIGEKSATKTIFGNDTNCHDFSDVMNSGNDGALPKGECSQQVESRLEELGPSKDGYVMKTAEVKDVEKSNVSISNGAETKHNNKSYKQLEETEPVRLTDEPQEIVDIRVEEHSKSKDGSETDVERVNGQTGQLIEDCNAVMERFCPNFDFEYNKKKKRELSKMCRKLGSQTETSVEKKEAPPLLNNSVIRATDKATDSKGDEVGEEEGDRDIKTEVKDMESYLPLKDDLSLGFKSLSLNERRSNIQDEHNDLKSRGPQQTNFQTPLGMDMQGGFPPGLELSIGQPKQPAAMSASNFSGMHTVIINDSNCSQIGGMSSPWLIPENIYSNVPHYPCISSPSNSQSLQTFDYAGQLSPQSGHESLLNMRTVVAKGIQVALPGDSQPSDKMHEVIEGWEHNVTHNQVENVTTRDYVESTWPPSPYSPLENPPSVSSDGSVVEPSSPYNPALSPSCGSTGSVVHSPAPTPVCQPGQMQLLQQECSYTICPNNTNIATVKASRCSQSQSFESLKVAQLVEYLKQEETLTMAPPGTLSGTLPGIGILLPPLKKQRPSPYPMQASQLPASAYTSTCPTQHHQISVHPHDPFQVPERGIEIQIPTRSSAPVASTQKWEIKAQMMTAAELTRRDFNEPFEGEDMLQKLIVNRMEEASIAIINRMYQLGLSLDGTNKQKQSSVLLAVLNNMPRVVEYLVRYNADIMAADSRGTCPIHYVASHGFMEILKAIYNGCSQQINWDHLNFDGKSALMCAVEVHRTEQIFYDNAYEELRVVDNLLMVKALLQCGAKPSVQDIHSGKTALHYAISYYKFDMMEVLLTDQLGVVGIPMSDGNTPLHLAVGLRCDQETKCKIVNFLIHKGADITATNAAKDKPINVVSSSHKEVEKLLNSYSGRGRNGRIQTAQY